jgi:ATP-dependent helicase/nuclease subunit B
MPTTLKLAPAASGKTRWCIGKVRAALQATPLAEVWAILPDRNQAASFTRRLTDAGGALGARVVTLDDVYAELAVRGGTPQPVASDQAVARLTRRAIDELVAPKALPYYDANHALPGFARAVVDLIAEGKRAIDELVAPKALPYYHAIHALPGFARAVVDLIAEWKSATISPAQLAAAVQERGEWLVELAAIYTQYQKTLADMGWTDPPGQGWQAIVALKENQGLASNWRLLVVDGFDSFPPLALAVIKLLADRTHETLVTLTGDTEMTRPAYRRFRRTLEQLCSALTPQIETLAPHTVAVPELAHLRASLFEADATTVASTAVQFLEARTTAIEAREALRWLKARIVRDGVLPDECAVIARDLPSYRPFLREAAAEFGLPLRFLGSEPLSASALVSAILGALRLPLQDWPRRALLDALRTPYFDLSYCKLSARDAALFDEVAYAGQIISGLASWETLLTDQAKSTQNVPADEDDEAAMRLPVRQEAQRLLDGLRSFTNALKPPADGPLSEHVRWVEHQILEAGGLGIRPQLAATGAAAYADRKALKEFAATLRALVSMEVALGGRPSVSYARFVSELQTAVDAASYQPDPPESRRQPRIYAGNMNTTRGVPYEAVVILGLSEGRFPSPLAPDPFMPDAEIEHLREQGLSLEPRLRNDQQTLFYEAVSRASRFLLMTRPYLADDGEKWEPSPYWSEAQRLFNEQEPMRVGEMQPRDTRQASSTGELMCSLMALDALPKGYEPVVPLWQAARYSGKVLRARLARITEGIFEGSAPGLTARLMVRATTQPWSASRLEAYATCPYFFFASSSLALNLRETPVAGFQAHQLGSMLHAALEAVYKRVSLDTDLASLLAALDEVLPGLFVTAPHDFGFHESLLWKVEKQQLTELLRETLAGLAAVADGFQSTSFEQKFGIGTPGLILKTGSGPIKLRGVIDRIDVNAHGDFRVIDYKTGARGLEERDLIEGKRLQLPLYALAAEKMLGSGHAVDGFYWQIRAAEQGRLRLASFHYVGDDGRTYNGPRGAMELAQEFVNAYITQIVAGNFAPLAPRNGCPNYCPAKRYCWHYAPGWRP